MSNFRYLIFLLSMIMAFGCIKAPEETEKVTGKNNSIYSKCDLSNLGKSTSLGSPTTINEATDLVNALPKPVTISCFLQALNRPLKIYATNSNGSAQPAQGNDNPRIFIFSGNLIMSVIPVGAGSDLLEFSQLISSNKSIKAELEFPVASNINYADAYNKINNYNGTTTCNACHGNDTLEASITEAQAFSSNAFKPFSSSKVTVESLKNEAYLCDIYVDSSDRCEMIQSIFANGSVIHQEFPAGMPTI